MTSSSSSPSNSAAAALRRSSRPPTPDAPERIGRFTLDSLIGEGGMAAVYLGSCVGAADFSRLVAVKRMHGQYARNPEFVSRFRDEAWLCARLLHPNLVQTLDVVESGEELLLVMEFVDGVTLRALHSDATQAGIGMPVAIAIGILVPALHGLHAAHEATDDEGQPLGLVHRDFTPHNIVVSRDGHAKVLDFGIAKARGQLHATSAGAISGKFAYLSPEQIRQSNIDRRADVFAAGIVLWELLTGERLFREPGLMEAAILERVLSKTIPCPSSKNPEVSAGLDAIVLKALAREPDERFESARALALALEAEVPPATASRIEQFVARVSGPRLAKLAELQAGVRRRALTVPVPQSTPMTGLAAPAAEFEDTTADPAAARPELSRVSAVPARGARGWFVPAVVGALLSAGIVAALPALIREFRAEPAAEPQAPLEAAAPRVSLAALRASAPPELTRAQPASVVPPATSSPEPARAPADRERELTAPAPRKKSLSISTRGAKPDKRPVSRAPSAASAKPAGGRCNPPTYVDAEGIRHFKEGCL